MNTVSFQNKGLIDPVAIKTFGISAKECEDPIGFFGTGLKYAIAILLRERCEITVYRGHEAISFFTKTITVRGKEFEIICMQREHEDPVDLAFTLDLGKTWEVWQAFRELYCNTLDEQGETFGNAIPLLEDHTTIVVTGEPFYDEYVHKDKILLLAKPQHVESSIEIHERAGDTIHFQGVRVGRFERRSIFTYNVLSGIKLTEDRTVKDIGDVNTAIRCAILRSENKELIKRFITAPKDSYEATIDLDWFETPGDTFMEVVKETSFNKIENRTLLTLYSKHKKKNKVPESIKDLTDVEKQQLRKAIDFSHLLDFPVDQYPIHVTDDVHNETLGMAYNEEIYIARRTFMMGTKMVAATIIEEYLHLEKGFSDCTYAMQNFLFEKIVTIGEQLLEEAL